MRVTLFALVALAGAAPLAAQSRDTTVGPVLSLEDAMSIAQRNNPVHQQTIDARQRAGIRLRTAYGQFLPNVSTSFSSQYREGRQQFVNGVAFGASTDVLNSSAGININADYGMGTFLAPKAARAQVEAADADVVTSQQNLRTTVAQQYMLVLQRQAQASLQDTLLISAQAQLDLAQARMQAGIANILDVRRAEVAVGQQQVAVLTARNQIEIEKLRLFQQMGVAQPANVRLSTSLQVTQPSFSLDELLASARARNPTINSFRARERAAELDVRQARALYLPTLSVGTGIGGYTSQQTNPDLAIERERLQTLQSRASCFSQDSVRRGSGLSSIASRCSEISFTDADAAAMRSANSQFPFSFTRNPVTFGVTLSLPLFDGFTREQRVQEAAVNRMDARYNVRAQELALTAGITQALLTLQTHFQTIRMQEANSATAREAMRLAEERFRVGANTFVDVVQARSDFARAETERINAIYEFHRAFAALENAVGRPLR